MIAFDYLFTNISSANNAFVMLNIVKYVLNISNNDVLDISFDNVSQLILTNR